MQVFRHLPTAPAGPIALTIGNFDGVHRGHAAMLSRLAALARPHRWPVCVMTFEPHPREFFTPADAPARLTPLREKLELLGALSADRVYVCRFDAEFARQPAASFAYGLLAERLGVRALLVGEDFRFGAGRQGGLELLREAGAKTAMSVDTLPAVSLGGVRISSTAVRTALRDGDLATAQSYLGRPFSLSGRVVSGDRIGRELGFPTANVRMRSNRPPLTGIFAVEVHGAGVRPLAGAASLGVRPTVSTSGIPVLEVFLLDFTGDLYGRRVRIDFLHKLRDEAKYPSWEALRAQIARDVDATHAFFAQRRSTAAPA